MIFDVFKAFKRKQYNVPEAIDQKKNNQETGNKQRTVGMPNEKLKFKLFADMKV